MSKESKKFSPSWKASKKPKKQRKYRFNAPLHSKHKLARAHLSKELRKKYGKRSAGLRKGDRVAVMRGEFTKKEGKIEAVLLKKSKVHVEGIEKTKKDGTKVRVPIDPSNLMIKELNLEDKYRQKMIERKK